MRLAVELQAIPLKADEKGVMRVGNTRVTLDTVVYAFEEGNTAEEIVSHYPTLQLPDVYAVIAYYLNNQPEVRAYIQQQEAETEQIWEQIETKADYQSFRKRLFAHHR